MLPARRHCLLLAPALLLSACAQKPLRAPLAAGPRTQWDGRLSLRVETDPVQSMTAAFDLRGSASAGELSLYTPLGSTLARMLWSAGAAELQWNGQRRNFDSMDDLTRRQAFGATWYAHAERGAAADFRMTAGAVSTR
jgi:outer membrane biogenesis lipoprotein LolB